MFTWEICPLHNPFSSPKAAILSVSTKNNDLWPVPKYAQWRCIFVTISNHYCFKLLSLRRRAGSPWFTDFLVWNQPEVIILGADWKNHSLGKRKCPQSTSRWLSLKESYPLPLGISSNPLQYGYKDIAWHTIHNHFKREFKIRISWIMITPG